MKESQLLRITGIIMIIGGAASILMGILGIAGGALVSASAGAEFTGGLVILASVFTIVAGAVELVAGILGAKNWQNPAKAQSCLVLGIILIALSLISNILSIVMSGFTASMLFGILIGLVLPVLYVVGAMQLKKAA